MPPQHQDEKASHVIPTDRDDAYLVLLQRHHLLDTGQLYKGTEHFGEEGRPNYTAHQQRLGKLASVPDKFGRIYIEAVKIPTTRNPLSLMKVYRLAQGGYDRLAQLGKHDWYAHRKGDPYVHRYGTGSLTFSFELGCTARPNLEYISAEEHFHDLRCPDARRLEAAKRNPLKIDSAEGEIAPDDLFGIRYLAEGKALFIAPEKDRMTETVNPRIHPDSIIAKKVRAYVDIIRNRKYRAHWGIPNLLPLFATVNERHMQTLKAHVRENVKDPKIAGSFLFSFNTRFGENWHTTPIGYETVSPPGKKPFLIPKEVFVEDILATPLETIDGVYDLTVPH